MRSFFVIRRSFVLRPDARLPEERLPDRLFEVLRFEVLRFPVAMKHTPLFLNNKVYCIIFYRRCHPKASKIPSSFTAFNQLI